HRDGIGRRIHQRHPERRLLAQGALLGQQARPRALLLLPRRRHFYFCIQYVPPVRISERVVDVVFRAWSGFYDAPFLQKTFYRRVHAAVLREVVGLEPRAVVDLGCGTALLTADLRARLPSARVVAGADLSHEMLREGLRRHDSLVRANVYALPFAS